MTNRASSVGDHCQNHGLDGLQDDTDSNVRSDDLSPSVKSINPWQSVIQTLPPGYKQTEVGEIPEDWAIEALGSLCEIVAGRDLVKEDFSPVTDDQHRHPIYSNALTGKGLYGYSRNYQYERNKITVTTLAEQQAIAEALSDADALIEILEQLIAKKR